MANTRDVESSYLYAKSVVEGWQADFLKEWFQPDIDLSLLILADRLDKDPVLRESLRQVSKPEEWQAFTQRIAEARMRFQNGS